MSDKVVVVISGGLDSSALLAEVTARGFESYCISFDYGQRHRKELDCAGYQAEEFDATHRIVDLSLMSRQLFAESGSSLVTDTAVPEGHYAADNMKQTVVPNRNMIMFSIAMGYAVSIEAEAVAMGMHAGDHFVYPDCRPEFVRALEHAAREGNEGFAHPGFHFMTPFILKSKNDIALRAVDLNVDIANTWSCYKGGDIHCGKCGTCVERREALESVKSVYPDFEDPTEYEDRDYWQQVVKKEI